VTDAADLRLPVRNPSGLHARPAALFVRTAGGYAAAITVRNATRGVGPVDAKSILGVMTLGVSRGHEIEIAARGDDAAEALAALRAVVESGLGESIGGEESA
jgi:phosphotransferase system HPr (HPr) family protein